MRFLSVDNIQDALAIYEHYIFRITKIGSQISMQVKQRN